MKILGIKGIWAFLSLKKLEVFITTPTFGSKTKPIYCSFYPFSVYKCQCQQLYNKVKSIYCKTFSP